MVDHPNCRCAIVPVKEEPKVFDIRWQRDYAYLELALVWANGGFLDCWVYLHRTTQFNSSVAVPVGYWELETIGL